jgi:hypothetical protein
MRDMPLLPADHPPPAELRTPDAVIRRQERGDAVADYEAVMSSKASLRVWCDDAWPEDTFTLEENRADLDGHIADARSGVAFGYTIWDGQGERVLGSLYLEQPAAVLATYEVDDAVRGALASCDVRVEYWLRDDVPDDAERRIVVAIEDWLARAWPFDRACWGSRRGMLARRALLESLGMEPLIVLRQPQGARAFHLHARLSPAPPPAPAPHRR